MKFSSMACFLWLDYDSTACAKNSQVLTASNNQTYMKFFVGTRLDWLYRTCFALLVTVLTGCLSSTDTPQEQTVEAARMVPFDEVFVLADTMVLDPAIILGRVWRVDADESGNVLVTDGDSWFVHLFDSQGHHITTFDWEVCYPNDSGGWVYAAQFADDGNIIVTTFLGQEVVIFDRSGNCIAAKRNMEWRSFCTWDDSLFAYQGLQGPERKAVFEVFTMDLTLQRVIELASSEFPRLNSSGYLGDGGRDMACFQNGPLYKNFEYMDGRPISGLGPRPMVRPEFFVERDTDVPIVQNQAARRRAREAFPSLSGLYALEEDVRMMRFSGIDESYRLAGDTRRQVVGLSIASNDNRFDAISTASPIGFSGARHGHLYTIGRSMPTPDGDVSNSTIVRYRFIPPTDN